MPRGQRDTPTELTLKYEHLSKNIIDGYPFYNLYINGDSYRALPLDANVRLPSDKALPFKGMVDTLMSDPKSFFLRNNGMGVIASKVKLNESKKEVTIKFDPNTGIVNGGHTQLAILEVQKLQSIRDAIIKMDVIVHDFKLEELAMIAASRNTASNVKDYSTAEKKGFFTKIKSEMEDIFEKHIIWYENRDVPNSGLDPYDLIARLNLFNVKIYQSNINEIIDQPNKSATSKGAVFKQWMKDQEVFCHTYPLTDDILRLEEHILSTFHKDIPRGFTNLAPVKKIENGKKTMCLGKEIKYEMPRQFLYPILASLRAGIKYDEANQRIGWYENPEYLFDSCKSDLIATLSKTYKSTYHSEINRASKDSNLWQILYSIVDRKVDKGSEWELYDIQR